MKVFAFGILLFVCVILSVEAKDREKRQASGVVPLIIAKKAVGFKAVKLLFLKKLKAGFIGRRFFAGRNNGGQNGWAPEGEMNHGWNQMNHGWNNGGNSGWNGDQMNNEEFSAPPKPNYNQNSY